jgi:hypothetical protein
MTRCRGHVCSENWACWPQGIGIVSRGNAHASKHKSSSDDIIGGLQSYRLTVRRRSAHGEDHVVSIIALVLGMHVHCRYREGSIGSKRGDGSRAHEAFVLLPGTMGGCDNPCFPNDACASIDIAVLVYAQLHDEVVLVLPSCC